MSKKTDIWMPLYIGDYLADTSHLDAQRHGCYLLWMMHYWRKGPLMNDIADLVSIGKLRGSNAPSIAQALLDEFFSLNGDGHWHQKRQDLEKLKWQDKQLKAQEKAKKAAGARWGDDASSNASSIPPSNAQSNAYAMLEPMLNECPAPLPLPVPLPNTEEQQPSRAKARGVKETPKTDLAKARHAEFKSIIAEYWDSKNKGVQMPWDGREGKHLEMFLRAAPEITAEQFRGFLRNRYKSEVNHGERPSQWIDWVTSYAAGPMDRFGKTLGSESNGTPKIRLHKIGESMS